MLTPHLTLAVLLGVILFAILCGILFMTIEFRTNDSVDCNDAIEAFLKGLTVGALLGVLCGMLFVCCWKASH